MAAQTNICGQMPCRIPHRNGERRRQAWAPSPIGLGHCWCPPGAASGCPGVLACCPSCACRLFACSQEKEAEAGALKGFFSSRLKEEQKSSSCLRCLPQGKADAHAPESFSPGKGSELWAAWQRGAEGEHLPSPGLTHATHTSSPPAPSRQQQLPVLQRAGKACKVLKPWQR